MKVKSIKTFRGKGNKIVGYRLQDKQGITCDMSSEELKRAIKIGAIEVVNLTLTSDNRLVSTKEKMQGSQSVCSECIITREFIKNLSSKYPNRALSFKKVDNETKELMVLRAAKDLKQDIISGKNHTVIANNRDIVCLANYFRIVDASMLFAGTTFRKIDLRNVDTSKVTNMSEMFRSCQVKELNLSNFDTSNVSNMSYMFSECEAHSLNLSGFDTHNVENMYSMFLHCKAKELNLSSFDTSNVRDMSWMFVGYRGKDLDLRSFDMNRVLNTEDMFSLCTAEIKVADNKSGKKILKEYERREK